MKHPFASHATRAAALVLALSGAANAQVPALEVIATADGLTTSPGAVRHFHKITGGADTGWVATATVIDSAGHQVSSLFGELSASDPAGPRLLRQPGLVAGIQQGALSDPSLAASRIAYLSEGTVTSSQTAWLDDQPLTSVQGPAGSTGQTWSRLSAVFATTNGDVAVQGRLSGFNPNIDVVVLYPGGQALLQNGQAVPGTTETVDRIQSFDLSPDGQHHAARVTLSPSGDQAVLLDGALHTLGDGSPVRVGESISPLVLNHPINGTWVSLGRPQVNSAGSIAFSAYYGDTTSTFQGTFRDRRELPNRLAPFHPLEPADLDERGFALYATEYNALLSATVELERLALSPLDVDFDGDGIADPGYSVRNSSIVDRHSAMNGAGGVYGLFELRTPGGVPFQQAVVRSTYVQEGSQYCPGDENSTGDPVRLISVGSDIPAVNRMKLTALGFPDQSLAMPLFSLSPGAGVQPPGSSGTLCLSGAIGRGYYSQMSPGRMGVDSADILLHAIPQPSGTQPVLPGDTWYVQLWYRDVIGTSATSNFSDAISIRFR